MSRSLWLGKMFEGIAMGVGGGVGVCGGVWGCVGGGGISDLCHGVDGQGR